MKRKKYKEEKTGKGTYRLGEVLKRMLGILVQKDKPLLAMVAVYTLAAGIYPFFSIFLPKIAIGILESRKADAGVRLAGAMGIYALLAGLTGWVMVYLQQTTGMRKIRLRMHYLEAACRKLFNMDYKYTEDAHFYEEYDKALNAGNDNVSGIEGIYGKLLLLPAQLLSILGMFFMVGRLHLLILLCILLHAAVSMWVARQNYKYEYSTKEEQARAERKIDYFYKTTHDFSYGKDIRIYRLQDRIMKNYSGEILALQAIVKRIKGREYRFSFLSLLTLLLTNAAMYGILLTEAHNGMPVSSFTMYVSAINSLMTALLTFGETLSFLADQGQYAADFFRLMDTSLVTEGGLAQKPEGTLEVVFDQVSFRYPGSDRDVFKDLSLTIHKGEKLAVVGINGAGKSTLVKLMTGLYEPTAGRILINGRDSREYRKKELYAMFSVVFQEVNILAFTIGENVACTSDKIDQGRVQTALEKVGLWEKVKGFEKGTSQMMLKVIDEDGTDFSGGERQKLAIARGLYKDANMVIMDEPTAALDALAEAEIYENFSTLTEGKTAVYISHRLASTKFCDKIALFDKDGLKEYGSHEELMAKKGSYYEMFTIQGKYYQDTAV